MADAPTQQIAYRTGNDIPYDQFVAVYEASTLAERRPTKDRARMERMLAHANLVVTAWDGERLVGIARCLTDFAYAAYLSDLAVDRAYQRQGIGRELIHRVQLAIHPEAKVVLLAAPAAVEYYPRIGMERHPSAWTISGNGTLR